MDVPERRIGSADLLSAATPCSLFLPAAWLLISLFSSLLFLSFSWA